jgi:hypothetical protein
MGRKGRAGNIDDRPDPKKRFWINEPDGEGGKSQYQQTYM